MRWLLAGCCALALINISVAQSDHQLVKQSPRLSIMKISSEATISCLYSTAHLKGNVTWYKLESHNATEKHEVKTGERIHSRSVTRGEILLIPELTMKDKGLYVCEVDGRSGSGTELQVIIPVVCSKAQYRIKVKEALIVLQGLLLAVCIGAVLIRRQTLIQMEKNDSIYEEPETDHIYEGLTIETCGGGLYEELSIYAQAEGTEAPWE